MQTEPSNSGPTELAARSSSPTGMRQPTQSDDEISLLDLLIVLEERKRVILWVTAAFSIAKLDEAKEGALIHAIDPAISPHEKYSHKRALIMIAATGVGFSIGVFTVLLQAGFRNLKADPQARSKLAYLKGALALRTAAPRSARQSREPMGAP